MLVSFGRSLTFGEVAYRTVCRELRIAAHSPILWRWTTGGKHERSTRKCTLKLLITRFFVKGDSFVVNACLTRKGIDDWLVKKKYYCSRLEQRDCHHKNNCALAARVSTTPLCTRITQVMAKLLRACEGHSKKCLMCSCVCQAILTSICQYLIISCSFYMNFHDWSTWAINLFHILLASLYTVQPWIKSTLQLALWTSTIAGGGVTIVYSRHKFEFT